MILYRPGAQLRGFCIKKQAAQAACTGLAGLSRKSRRHIRGYFHGIGELHHPLSQYATLFLYADAVKNMTAIIDFFASIYFNVYAQRNCHLPVWA